MAERENSMPFMPEELVDQDYPNMGRISDVDLALKGAQAEDKIRSQKIRNEVDYFLSIIIDGLGRREKHLQERGNQKAEEAMEEEVWRRATNSLEYENISEEGKRAIAYDAVSSFTKEHENKTQRRIAMEVEETKKRKKAETRMKRINEENAKARERRNEERRERINKIFSI